VLCVARAIVRRVIRRKWGRGFSPGREAFVGFAVFLLAACGGAPPGTPPPAARISTPLEAIAPSGAINGPITFSWRGSSDDQVVRIYVVDAAERAVADFEARGRSVVAPQIIADAIEPGEKMGWRVAAIDTNGEPVRLSALTPFTWAPK